MHSIEKLLNLKVNKIKEAEKKLKSIKITYEQLKIILMTLNSSHYGSFEKMTDYLYDKNVLTYKRGSVKKIRKNTIKQYLNSCVELNIIFKDGKLTNLGRNLVNNLESENQFKKLLSSSLRNREDVKTIVSSLSELNIPTGDKFKEKIKEKMDIHQTTLSSLINLLDNCEIILKNRKITYHSLTLSSKILEVLQNSQENYSLNEIERFFKDSGYSGTEFQEEIIRLLINKQIRFTEQISENIIKLLDLTIRFKGTINPPVTIKMNEEYLNYLINNNIPDPESYIDGLVEKNPDYLKYAPLTSKSHKGLFTFGKIAPYTSIIQLI